MTVKEKTVIFALGDLMFIIRRQKLKAKMHQQYAFIGYIAPTSVPSLNAKGVVTIIEDNR